MKKYYQADLVKNEVPFEAIPQEVRAQYLRPGELLAIQERFPVAFLPIGTLEWHGRHNPIGCDAIKAERLCIETAKLIGGVVMPSIYFSADAYINADDNGYGLGMDAFAGFQLPGSLYEIDSKLLKKFMVNACKNCLSRGFKLVIIVSGHNPGIQENLLSEVCYMMKTFEGEEPVQFTMEYTVIEAGNPRRASDHGSGYETSMMLFLTGDRVNLKANDGQKRPELAISGNTSYITATSEEGENCFNLQVEGLTRFTRNKLEKLANCGI